jgi:hypothetical protein
VAFSDQISERGARRFWNEIAAKCVPVNSAPNATIPYGSRLKPIGIEISEKSGGDGANSAEITVWISVGEGWALWLESELMDSEFLGRPLEVMGGVDYNAGGRRLCGEDQSGDHSVRNCCTLTVPDRSHFIIPRNRAIFNV